MNSLKINPSSVLVVFIILQIKEESQSFVSVFLQVVAGSQSFHFCLFFLSFFFAHLLVSCFWVSFMKTKRKYLGLAVSMGSFIFH